MNGDTGGTAEAIHDWPAFIRAHTVLSTLPLVPEIAIHQASEVTPIWEATEAELEAMGLPPPFWAFAWAGGQALARYLLDHPEVVRGGRVLDFAAGSGVEGIAAAMAGAASVTAVDIDPVAGAAIALNAAANGVTLDIRIGDIVDSPQPEVEIVLAGDICYERGPAERITAWLRGLAAAGALVLLGDPNRTYMPKTGLERITGYAVKTTKAIEDTDLRNASVWRVLPEG